MTTEASVEGDTDPFRTAGHAAARASDRPVSLRRRGHAPQRSSAGLAAAYGYALWAPRACWAKRKTSTRSTCWATKKLSAVFRDGETYSSALIGEAIGPLLAHTMVAMDGPSTAHTVPWSLRHSGRSSSSHWESESFAPIAHELIDSFVGLGEVDLVRRFTFALPVRVITQIFGVPHERRAEVPTLVDRDDQHPAGLGPGHGGVRGSARLLQRAGRAAAPRASGRSDHRARRSRGRRAAGSADEEIFAFLRLLLPAGVETTYRSLGNLLFALLTHPDQLEEVRANPALIPAAIEEGLRWQPPIFHTGRHQHQAQPARRRGHTVGRAS